jgi:ACS family hexuronate transporter-like MFS transporter
VSLRLADFPYRWRIVALLFLLSVVNYLDRQTLSVLAPTLRAELGFTTVEYSYVVSSFLVAYTLGYLFCGKAIDRMGVRLAVVVALSVWSFAGAAHAFAGGWLALAACRFVLGLGESFNAPCGIKAIAEWTPRRERGLSMAIFSNGNIVGAIVAPPLVSFVGLKFGWQWGFIATGAAGFGYLALWLASYRSPEKQPRLSTAERALILRERGAPPNEPAPSFFAACRHPMLQGLFLARLLTDSFSFFFTFWLPEYLQSSRGFTLAMIGIFGWIPFLASDIGGPGGGALSDWLVRRGWHPAAARRQLMFAAAALMPLSLVAVHVPNAYAALGLIAVLLAAQSCWLVNLMTLMAESFPRGHLGTYAAIASVGGSLGGILTTLLAGRVIAAAGYTPVFTVLGFLHLVAFGVLRHFSSRAALAFPA